MMSDELKKKRKPDHLWIIYCLSSSLIIPHTSLQIITNRRLEQGLHLRLVDVVGRDHLHARVYHLLDRLALQVLDHRAHAEVAHMKRVLHDEAVQLFRVHGVDERLARIEADEHYLARLVDVLERQQHPGG